MWKILRVQIGEDIYYLLISRRLFPKGQKGNKRNKRPQIHWSIHPLGEQNKTKNIAKVWIDNKKAYDMVPQSCIVDCHKMYKISDEVVKFIQKTTKNWRVEVTAVGKILAEVKIQRGIFHGNGLSPLLFIIAMMSLNHIGGYNHHKSQKNINHLMYIDTINLSVKNEKEVKT